MRHLLTTNRRESNYNLSSNRARSRACGLINDIVVAIHLHAQRSRPLLEPPMFRLRVTGVERTGGIAHIPYMIV